MGCERNGSRRSCLATNKGMEVAMEHYQNDEAKGFHDPLRAEAEGEGEGGVAAAAAAAAARGGKGKKRHRERRLLFELQRLFAQLQGLEQRSVATEELTTKVFQFKAATRRCSTTCRS